jgi:tetratricopeptide (TPR) repeat protein
MRQQSSTASTPSSGDLGLAADDWPALAAEAMTLSAVSPEEADLVGMRAEEGALECGDWEAVSVARRARGVAAVQLRQLDLAVDRLRGSVAAARRIADPQLMGEAHMSLASALALRGSTKQAFDSIQTALNHLSGVKAARARTQRSAILQELGQVDEALDDLRVSLPVLRRHGDVQWETRALSNRSLLLNARRQFAAAEADLVRARSLCIEHGLTLGGAYVEQNLGCVYAARGDVPAALECFDAAAARYRKLGMEVGSLLVDRATVLLSVRLIDEARRTAEAAVAAYTAQHREMHLPEAQLLLSTAALLDDDVDTARSMAAAAGRAFARLGRREWLALSRHAVLQADVAATKPGNAGSGVIDASGRPRVSSGRARACATELEKAGWTVPALEARVMAARLALEESRPRAAHVDLAVAARARHSGPADARARAWLAEGLLRQAEGNRRGAYSALRTGLRVVEDYQASMGATELRAHVSVHRGALARAGLAMALERRDARAAHWWSERGRASTIQMRPVRPPDDPGMAHDLQDLRATMAEIEQSRGSGSPVGSLISRQVELENQIRERCRRSPGSIGRAPEAPAINDIASALGDNALVEYLNLDEVLHALTIVDGRVRLHTLGKVAPVRNCLMQVPFALHRLATPPYSAKRFHAAEMVLSRAARLLDEALLAPLARIIGDRHLVLIPTGWLQSLPWSVLPSCAGRPVSVAPSAALWYAAHRRMSLRSDGVVVVAGPGLPGAVAEARAVASIYPESQELCGPAATAASVSTALAGAKVAHIAAHGVVRSDNPLFSSLLLSDGPFTVYDLERLGSTPRHVVLAACETARSHVTSGEEILGLAAALLSQNTATLVAPVLPIADAETVGLMTTYHQRLVAGEPPATALAQAQQSRAPDDLASWASAASFVCLGAGHTSSVDANVVASRETVGATSTGPPAAVAAV